jgi:hypothetical protein
MISWVAGLCFVIAVFVVFFFYVALGMTAGEAAANKFLLAALGAAVVVAAESYLWRRLVKD